MATLHGKNAAVYMAGSGAAAVPIAEAAEWTFNFEATFDPDPAFGDVWESSLRGLLRFSGTISGNFDTAQGDIFDSILATTPRNLYLYPDRSTPTRYYYAQVWPTLSGTVPMGTAKFTLNFTGASNFLAQN